MSIKKIFFISGLLFFNSLLTITKCNSECSFTFLKAFVLKAKGYLSSQRTHLVRPHCGFEMINPSNLKGRKSALTQEEIVFLLVTASSI